MHDGISHLRGQRVEVVAKLSDRLGVPDELVAERALARLLVYGCHEDPLS